MEDNKDIFERIELKALKISYNIIFWIIYFPLLLIIILLLLLGEIISKVKNIKHNKNKTMEDNEKDIETPDEEEEETPAEPESDEEDSEVE